LLGGVRERKKAVEALEKAGEFIPLDMLKAIPNPEKTITEADIEAQLQEALISTIAAINPSLDTAMDTTMDDTGVQVDYIASQADFIPIMGLDSKDIMDYNYLDADDDADTGLF
jgi:hypothetical protein